MVSLANESQATTMFQIPSATFSDNWYTCNFSKFVLSMGASILTSETNKTSKHKVQRAKYGRHTLAFFINPNFLSGPRNIASAATKTITIPSNISTMSLET
jgi:hypothetical protein